MPRELRSLQSKRRRLSSFWGGGLPGIAAALGFAMDSEVYRPKAAPQKLRSAVSLSASLLIPSQSLLRLGR